MNNTDYSVKCTDNNYQCKEEEVEITLTSLSDSLTKISSTDTINDCTISTASSYYDYGKILSGEDYRKKSLEDVCRATIAYLCGLDPEDNSNIVIPEKLQDFINLQAFL